ncbi:helix-turn-helix domain-containing protein [Nonomuraea sp. NPDC002799]
MQLSVVAARLATLRAECRMSMKVAARAAGLNTSTIFRIEHGLVAPRESTVRTLLELYGEGEHAPRLLSLLREERVPGWYDAPAVPIGLSGFLALEDRAQVIYTYCPRHVPPLLQTQAYAESAAYAALPPGAPHERIARVADLAGRRQTVLGRRDGPHLWTVLDRHALLDPPLPDPGDRLAQLDAIMQAVQRPHIAVQLARPRAETGYVYQGPPFTLLRFPEPDRADVLVLHLLHAPVVIEDRRRIEEHQQAFARLSLSAFPRDRTADVLAGLRGTLTA